MKAVIDTNILIDLFKGVEQAKIELGRYESPIISIITWMEIFAGVRNEEEEHIIRAYLESFKVEAVDTVIGWEAVKIRQTRKKKLPDAIIEATAKVNETILVTRDIKDFDQGLPYIRIPYALN